MNASRLLGEIVPAGARDSLRVRLWLPLYLVSLAFGIVQAAPGFDSAALHNPYLSDLASGGLDAWTDAALSDPRAASGAALQWSVLALGMWVLYGAAYNAVSGAMLSRWFGGRGYAAGGRRWFLSFAALGIALLILLAICAVLTAILGALAGVAAIVIFVIAGQGLNLLGELARALAVRTDRLNPLPSLAAALRMMLREPVALLAIALAGFALHALLLVVAVLIGSATLHPVIGLLAQQIVVMAWIWIKVLRLAWASKLVGALYSQ